MSTTPMTTETTTEAPVDQDDYEAWMEARIDEISRKKQAGETVEIPADLAEYLGIDMCDEAGPDIEPDDPDEETDDEQE